MPLILTLLKIQEQFRFKSRFKKNYVFFILKLANKIILYQLILEETINWILKMILSKIAFIQ